MKQSIIKLFCKHKWEIYYERDSKGAEFKCIKCKKHKIDPILAIEMALGSIKNGIEKGWY
jgi:hypothetical protein